MRRYNCITFYQQIAVLVVLGLLSLSVGCGGSSSTQNPMTSSNSPAAASPNPPASTSPPPAPTPTPTATSADAYMATMFLIADGASAMPKGTVIVNAQADNGSGTLQIGGGQPNTSYDLQFCSGGPPPSAGCVSIATYTTDTNGSANITFQVPAGPSSNSGYHVGSFYVLNNGNPVYAGGADAQAAGTSFRAAILPGLPGNPPGGGSVSASGQTLHVALSGVPPSMSYEVLLCSPTAGGAGCNSFGTDTVDVDTQGNGAKDFSLPSGTFVGFVQVQNHLNQFYVTGFRVP